jgi:hypothetical protein
LVVAGPTPAQAQVLPWEVTLAEIESGRLRGLIQRLSKQQVLYQLRLGDVRKDDLVATATRIDRVLESLVKGSPSYAIPEPWTPALRKQLEEVDALWGPLRRIAVASAYDSMRLYREYISPQNRRGDPLLLGYFDELSLEFVAATEKLIDAYDEECQKTGLEVCATARTSGYAAMLIERAAKEAVYVAAGMDVKANRKRLEATIAAYQELRSANQTSPFMAAALDPERGLSAKAALGLLKSLRDDWDAMQEQFTMLAAGDEENFDLAGMLSVQGRLVSKVERLTAALVRYASLTYGS